MRVLENKTAAELLEFIGKSPSCYHAVENIRRILLAEGYRELREWEPWQLREGGRYFTARNDSSLIAFRVPARDFSGFQMAAAHSDAPTFKLKENPELPDAHYLRLNTEPYGGMLMASWFDRPLSVAGRVMARENGRVVQKLAAVDRDLVVIPNVAIHMNREANDGFKYLANVDLVPLLGAPESRGKLAALVAGAAGVRAEDVLGCDLFLYNRQPGTFLGAEGEFLASPKLDDLECAFGVLRGFLAAQESRSVPVCAIFDNEEVGSLTKQGADSTFLSDTLRRVSLGLGRTEEEHRMALAQSFLVSADNAHAQHPNHPEYADGQNCPYMNGGVVIKYNANQHYTTDAVSSALFREICRGAEVPVQTFANRSDLRGGSTLGNISSAQVSVNTVDIGLAQLAMHSSYETGGALDPEYLVRAMGAYFSAGIRRQEDGGYTL